MSTPAIEKAPHPSTDQLRRSHRGPVLAPGDDGYDAARQAWNAMVDKRPAIVAQPEDAADVAAAIAHARMHELEIGVKCGGHGILGQAIPEGGLQIDLSRLNAVRIDPQQRLAYVQGGALLGDMDRASTEHGLATTAGNVSHTGVGGLTLGGGMGWLARQFGMACDNVISFQVVTADGSLLTASADENPDLYWGLRGGGGNFGVVTEFTFRLHPITNRVLSVDLFFEADATADLARAFRELTQSAPEEATLSVWTGTAGPWEILPEERQGTDVAILGFVYVGDPDRGRELLPAFRAVGPRIAEDISEMSYVELQSGSDSPMGHNIRRYWKDHYLRELSEQAIEAFSGRGGAGTGGQVRSNGLMQSYGGAISRVGIEDTAFSHRDAKFEFITMAGWEDPGEDEARMDAARRFASAMEPFASGAYVNGLSDEGAAGVSQAYSEETLTRLTALKDLYDPDNVFHLNHNIAPSRAVSDGAG